MNTKIYDEVVQICQQTGKDRDLYHILRIQHRSDLVIAINNGQTEEISTGNLDGMGIQVFTADGSMGFAAADQINEATALSLYEKAAYLAKAGFSKYSETNQEIFSAEPVQGQTELPVEYPRDSLSLAELEERLRSLNQEIVGLDPRLSVRSLLKLTEEVWRISRSDGNDVSFNTPRAFVFHTITAKSDNQTATTYANLPGNDLGVLLDEGSQRRLKLRAHKAAKLALNLLGAPKFPGGSYKLVIDYALAKGLAHEAFGHAAETDGMESSILGEEGRMKLGMKVADSRLSIIDGPLEGDYAYQPFSAVGTKRETVKIVDKGILSAGLADIFSARRAGVAPTGAERVESCFQLPIARMSNIRIEWEGAIPIEQDFEQVTAKDLYEVMVREGLMTPGEKVLYLSGFQGGQVNPAFGDFVFNCSAIYELAEEPVLYQPAIFSGKILSVLQSVSGALGDLQIDAMGTCGKMGQGVPSCGGSHYFLVIEENPEVMIGGE